MIKLQHIIKHKRVILLYWVYLIIFFTFFQYGLFKLHNIRILNLIDEALIIGLFSVLIVLLIKKKIDLKIKKYEVFGLLLLLWAVITSVVNKVPFTNFILGMKGYFIYFLLFYAIKFLKLKIDEIQAIIKFTLNIFLVQFFIALLQLVFAFFNNTLNPDSIAGTLNGANFFGYSIFALLYFSLYNYYFNSKKEYFIYVISFTILLLLSSARFAILLFPVIFIIFNIKLLINKFTLKKFLSLFVVFLVTISVVFIMNPEFIGGGRHIFDFYRVSTLKEHFTQSEFNVSSGSARNLWYPLTKNNLEEHSISPVLGFGVGMYASYAAFNLMPETNLLIYDYFNQTSSGFDANIDSQIIPVWGELGYVGLFLLYLFLIFIVIRMFIKTNATKNNYLKALASTTMAYTIFFIFGFYINHLLESQTTGLILFLLLSLTETYEQLKEYKVKKTKRGTKK